MLRLVKKCGSVWAKTRLKFREVRRTRVKLPFANNRTRQNGAPEKRGICRRRRRGRAVIPLSYCSAPPMLYPDNFSLFFYHYKSFAVCALLTAHCTDKHHKQNNRTGSHQHTHTEGHHTHTFNRFTAPTRRRVQPNRTRPKTVHCETTPSSVAIVTRKKKSEEHAIAQTGDSSTSYSFCPIFPCHDGTFETELSHRTFRGTFRREHAFSSHTKSDDQSVPMENPFVL